MNKQAKLFSQGMRPVVRIGDTGKWELTKENPTYYVKKKTNKTNIVKHNKTLFNKFLFHFFPPRNRLKMKISPYHFYTNLAIILM